MWAYISSNGFYWICSQFKEDSNGSPCSATGIQGVYVTINYRLQISCYSRFFQKLPAVRFICKFSILICLFTGVKSFHNRIISSFNRKSSEAALACASKEEMVSKVIFLKISSKIYSLQ